MSKIDEKFLDSLPKFNGGTIIQCYAMDEMEKHYEILSPTSHYNQDEMKTVCKWITDLRRRQIAHVLTAKQNGYQVFYHLWVKGEQKLVVNAEINKSTRLRGAVNAG